MIKMSILNHFGKVKASYTKYNSNLPEYKGYVFDIKVNSVRDLHDLRAIYYSASIHTGGHDKRDYGVCHDPDRCNPNFIKKINIPDEYATLPGKEHFNHLNMIAKASINVTDTYISSLSPEKYLFSFTNLVETFSKCYEKVREKMYSELWKTMDCCPFINIIDLLILKHSDTDKHIEYLEDIIKGLIHDNKLLQTKINSLESQMSLFKSKIPVAVALSEYVEKTVAEEILCE
jgi:hypothetical protein